MHKLYQARECKLKKINLTYHLYFVFQSVFTCYEYGITVCDGRCEELGTEATSKLKDQYK